MAKAIKQFFGRAYGNNYQEVALDELGQWWSRTISGLQDRDGRNRTICGWHPIRAEEVAPTKDEGRRDSIRGMWGPLRPVASPDARLPKSDAEKARLAEVKALRSWTARGKATKRAAGSL